MILQRVKSNERISTSNALQVKRYASLLTGKKINDKEYEHVITVWNRFEMKMMKDCHDLFLKFDVLLLPDLFEKIRSSSLKNYELCPSPYLRTLALSLGSMRNMPNANLTLFSDADMYLFFEKVLRGWVSYISERYSKVNNKYLKPCNLKQESKHIIYLDANDLYDL